MVQCGIPRKKALRSGFDYFRDYGKPAVQLVFPRDGKRVQHLVDCRQTWSDLVKLINACQHLPRFVEMRGWQPGLSPFFQKSPKLQRKNAKRS